MQPGVIPIPASMQVIEGEWLTVDGSIRIDGDPDAAAELFALIEARTGVEPAGGGASVTLGIGSGAPESYTLSVTATGATVEGADAAGLFYGVQTLAQLLTERDGGWALPVSRIEDAPRFAYRGFMLDVARHFFPVEVVERLIERIARLKFNHLHLHLSDDQGWRLALEARPELAELASSGAIAGADGGCFSRADYARIVAAAASHHITVVPEFDMPGHTHAVGLAYPHLAEAPVITDEVAAIIEEFGGGTPTPGEPYGGLAVGFSSLKIHDEATYDFVADVFDELAQLTPGPYLHLGGDEALGTTAQDFATFVSRASHIVADTGKTPVAWHEAGAVDALTPGTIGQYWGYATPIDSADEKARGFIARGGRIILSPADRIYLDMKPDADSALGLAWADGPTSIRDAYDWEPLDVVSGIAESDILGVEAALWTETIVTEQDIQAMVYPRITAAAEIAWSPASARSWSSFRERVSALSASWTDVAYTRVDGIDW